MSDINFHESQLDDVRDALRSMQRVTQGNTHLTAEGKREAYKAGVELDKAHQRIETHGAAVRAGLARAKAAAATERARLTAMPDDPTAALAAELRFSRRAKRIEAALNAEGMGPVQQLLAEASDADVALLVEHVRDHYQARGGKLADAGDQIIEQSLRARSPQYDAAATLAQQAATAEQVLDAKLAHLSELADNVDAGPLSEHSLAGRSVNVVSDALGDLDAA